MIQKQKVIALGTAAIGRPVYINIKKGDEKYSDINQFRNNGMEVLEYAYNHGVRHFDTAPNYGFAEEILIEFLKSGIYKDVTVSTKWGYTYTANFDSNAKTHEVKNHSLENLNRQWEQSQNLLPYLILYQIHSVTPDSYVLEDRNVLNRLYEIKKEHGIEIGITVSGPDQIKIIKKAMAIKVNNETLFSSYQVTFNILDQSLLKINSFLHDKKVLIKEAMANGRLLPNKDYSNYRKMYDYLSQLANKYNVTEDAIAISYCMQGIDSDIVLSGVNNKKHLDQNIKASSIKFSSSELESLRSFAIEPSIYWEERKKLKWN